MASLIEGYEYDIFISYRQKDNKYDGWVTEFVENLKSELDAAFKEEITVYFDINPHDGLLETHDVDASLKEKLKCLVFIPIISRTYCDPKSFAWEHEFKAFIEQTAQDQYGIKVKLPNGNVASRVLPVRIHELDSKDLMLCESALGGYLRGVEFIYKEPGVNRPLTAHDNEKTNINKTIYRNQINRIANAIREVVSGLKGEPLEVASETEPIVSPAEKPPAKEKSIAVLPFANMSADPEQEYFAEGIAEELLNALAHIHDLRVVARTSAFALKGMNLDIREIGRKLNVKTVLEGSVRKAGNRLRVTAQLINVEDGFHLWSDRYDRDMADIFAIQDEITEAIVDSLKMTLKVGEKTALRKRSTADPEAYNLYLKGLYFFARPSPEAFEKAMNCFQAAIDKDPNFAQAYSGMGQILAFMGIYHFAPPAEILPKAKAAIEKALSLDENLAEAHAVAASLAYWIEWDWETADRHFVRALSLNPGDALAHAHRGWLLATMNRHDEAIREVKAAQEIDPLMSVYYAWSAGIHGCAGKFDEALQECAKALEIDPNNGLAYYHAYSYYMVKGLLDKALEAFEKSKESGFFGFGSNAASIYLLKGDRENAERLFEEMIETKKTTPQVSSMLISGLAWNLGKRDLAFEFLDQAYEERDIQLPLIGNLARYFCPGMPADPRFKALLARMKLDFIPSPEENCPEPETPGFEHGP